MLPRAHEFEVCHVKRAAGIDVGLIPRYLLARQSALLSLYILPLREEVQ